MAAKYQWVGQPGNFDTGTDRSPAVLPKWASVIPVQVGPQTSLSGMVLDSCMDSYDASPFGIRHYLIFLYEERTPNRVLLRLNRQGCACQGELKSGSSVEIELLVSIVGDTKGDAEQQILSEVMISETVECAWKSLSHDDLRPLTVRRDL